MGEKCCRVVDITGGKKANYYHVSLGRIGSYVDCSEGFWQWVLTRETTERIELLLKLNLSRRGSIKSNLKPPCL